MSRIEAQIRRLNSELRAAESARDSAKARYLGKVNHYHLLNGLSSLTGADSMGLDPWADPLVRAAFDDYAQKNAEVRRIEREIAVLKDDRDYWQRHIDSHDVR